MIPEEYEDLLQAELDGENTPEDSARLRAWLARSAEGRARLQELQAVFHALARVERVEVPADLRRSVLEAIEFDSPEAAVPPGWGEAFAGAFARHPALRHAYPFAAGLVLGILAFTLLARVLPVPAHGPFPVAGTMAPMPQAPRGGLLERRVLVAGQERFTLETRRSRDVVELLLGGDPARDVKVAVDFDPQVLAAGGVEWMGPARGNLDFGHGRLLLEFREYAPVIARFRATGEQDAQVRVTFRWAGRSGEVVLRTGEVAATRARP